MDQSVDEGEWTTFNEVKAAMAEEERELSTDEEDVELPSRKELLDAAAARMLRDGEPDIAPAQAGVHSDDFNARASSVFNALGGGPQAGVSLRFWTSIHTGMAAQAKPDDAMGEPDAAGARTAGGDRVWRPVDDLDELSDYEESDLEDADGDLQYKGQSDTARKRAHGEQAEPRAGGEAHEVRARKARRPVVTFAPDVAAGETPSTAALALGQTTAALPERPGYRHYSLADVDADARMSPMQAAPTTGADNPPTNNDE